METAQYSLPRPDCNSTAGVPFFTLRTVLSAIKFVSDLCGVERTMIPGKVFTRFAKFQGIVSVNDFWFPRRLGSCKKNLICKGMIVSTLLPSPAPRLHIHDCFEITTFTEYFVICKNQITKIFRFGHDCTSTSSARNPCYFCLQADIAVWVFRKVRVYTMLARIRYHFCSRPHWKFMRRTAEVSSRSKTDTNKSNSRTYAVASSFAGTSPLAVTTVVGLFELLTVSNSAELRSFLLTICILAPESTTNSLSSGSFVDATGRTHLAMFYLGQFDLGQVRLRPGST